MLKRYLGRGGKVLFLIDPPDKAGAGELPGITALLKDWSIEVGNNIVVDVSGMGQLLGTGPETPVAAKYRSRADHRSLQSDHRLPAGTLGCANLGRHERQVPADAGRNQQRQLGGDRRQALEYHRPGLAGSRQRRQGEPDFACGSGLIAGDRHDPAG